MEEYEKFLKIVSKRTGLSYEEIKEKSPSDLKKYLETKNKKPFRFKSFFPFIGRSCIVRQFKTTKEIDKELDAALIS